MRKKTLLVTELREKHQELACADFDVTISHKGKWGEFFGEGRKDAPLVVDYGMGRGGYIIALALKNPEYNYVGLEFKRDRITQACQKLILAAQESGDATLLDRVRFGHSTESNLSDIFADGEVSRVMVNCPDPNERARGRRRRLVHENNFTHVVDVLGGVDEDPVQAGDVHGFSEFWLKTDHRDYFEHALVEVSRLMDMYFVSCDYRDSENTSRTGYKEDEYWDAIKHFDDPVTEYEEKWNKEGRRFYVLRATYRG